ncbi:tetratricopeptide repeat protein [Ekhidna sp.]|uniref:tetratricopeptide repeat protein n=1 Tax=Ekhidna sp. TaxID=2608089 RepID=UPI003C7C5794
MSVSLKKIITGLFVCCVIAMLWSYQAGYSLSIDWEVTTTGEVIEFPAWTLETDLMTYEIKGEKYLLSENYSGSEIKRDITSDQALMGIMWMGLCLAMAASTYLKRYAFFVAAALFALFLNRLNLFEVGLFGIHSRMVILLPFTLLITPLVIFHEYKKSTPFIARIGIMIALSVVIFFGVNQMELFTDHLIAHSLFGYTVCGLIFLFIISEEIIFGILYVVTSGKGGKSNHLHFVILSLIYLGNLILYYLNKSGLFENSFFFFDPFILLAISSLVALWSIRKKSGFLSKHVDNQTLLSLTLSLGIITFLFLTHQMIRGNDAVYQAFHYFILYFHIGFGTLFFFYIIGNFVDPLIKGFEVHKIAYKERNFPYTSARLGGIFAVLAFYFLANQEPYNLLKSGYYNYLAQKSKTEENILLAREYTLQASYLGYNTHMANYNLGWYELDRGAEFPAKTYFHSATQRYPSPYAWVNYGNLDLEVNPNKVQAIYEEALRKHGSGEMRNNLGIAHMQKENYEQALKYFQEASPSNKWNDAPLVNKWNIFKRLELVDSSAIDQDYEEGNFGVRSNVLTTQTDQTSLDFQYEGINQAEHLHRQAYLLNASFLFDHDSVEQLARKELKSASDGTYNSRLRKALAIHLYNKGKVNEAFMILDFLQANAHQYYKGEYLDALGKLALDQQAYQLSMEFFDQAIEVKHTESIFGKMEVMARMGRKDEIPTILLQRLKRNPELTDRANQVLSKLESYEAPAPQKQAISELKSMSDSTIIALGRMNAFHEAQVLAVVEELKNRGASGAYELLVDATEINPYSVPLLKAYALFALDWNLIEYADHAVEKLSKLLSYDEFIAFSRSYEKKKQELEEAEW